MFNSVITEDRFNPYKYTQKHLKRTKTDIKSKYVRVRSDGVDGKLQ